MSKLDKKRQKLRDRIAFLENEMQTNLRQKTSSTKEISVADYLAKIAELRTQLQTLK